MSVPRPGGGSWLRRDISRQIEVGGALKCQPSTLGRATMDADLDLLLIAVYCTVDDLLPKRAENARRRITDQKVITLCIAQAMLDGRSDEQLLAIAARGWCTCSRSGQSAAPSTSAAAP